MVSAYCDDHNEDTEDSVVFANTRSYVSKSVSRGLVVCNAGDSASSLLMGGRPATRDFSSCPKEKCVSFSKYRQQDTSILYEGSSFSALQEDTKFIHVSKSVLIVHVCFHHGTLVLIPQVDSIVYPDQLCAVYRIWNAMVVFLQRPYTVLHIQMELCLYTLKEWLAERNSSFTFKGKNHSTISCLKFVTVLQTVTLKMYLWQIPAVPWSVKKMLLKSSSRFWKALTTFTRMGSFTEIWRYCD